jgi:YegS/Rv2252/BmrU family lipid kinase
VTIIVNPLSGREGAERRRAQLMEAAETLGLRCELWETSNALGADELTRLLLTRGAERILVCGGDGTIATAAGALAGSDAALGILPAGTGNLVALNLGIPLDFPEALRIALTETPLPIDVGRANGCAFLVAAGMGVDARVVREARRSQKQRLGALAYFVAALRNVRQPPAQYTITVDGCCCRRRAQSVLVANMGRIQGGVELVPGADPEDGLLDVAILRVQGLGELFLAAVSILWRRKPLSPYLEVIRGRRIVVETDRPLPIQLDGDARGVTNRMEVEIEPGSLRVVRAARP